MTGPEVVVPGGESVTADSPIDPTEVVESTGEVETPAKKEKKDKDAGAEFTGTLPPLDTYRAKIEQIEKNRDSQVAAIRAEAQPKIEELQKKHAEEMAALVKTYEDRVTAAERAAKVGIERWEKAIKTIEEETLEAERREEEALADAAAESGASVVEQVK